MRKLTAEEFVARATARHGHEYDYGKVDYVHTRLRVIIICRRHGDFLQIANNHLAGAGCPSCSMELNKNHINKRAVKESEKRELDKDEVLENWWD